MDLSQIKNPLFLKDLSDADLKELCSQIREFIIDYCSRNGGYLSGNLSAVELSVVLNRVFEQDDHLLFDGNDLNYTNKILNGKIDELQVNSNGAYSLANAIGLAVSRDLDHKNHHVVAVVNSLDLLSGRYIEALNLISSLNRRLIIVFNDDTTIDKGIGLVDKLLSTLRNTRSYTNLKENVKGMIRPTKKGEEIIENIHNFKSSIKKNVLDEGIFGEYNIDYIGPIDGHSIKELTRAFDIARQKDYPVVVHCISTSGKGYKFAEASTNGSYNHVARFNRDTGEFILTEKEDFMFAKNIVGKTFEKMMADNEDLLCVTSRNINDYGVANIFGKYPSRSFDTSSSGDNTLSFASGLALDGKICLVPLKSFELSNAFRVLKNQICKLNRPMLIGIIDDGNINYDLLSNLNNIYIFEPKDSSELQNVLHGAINLDKPAIIIYPERCIEYKEIDDFSKFEVGIWPENGNNDIEGKILLSSGYELNEIEEIVKNNDMPIKVVEMNSYLPMDESFLKDELPQYEKVYVYGLNMQNRLLKFMNENDLKINFTFLDKRGVKELLDNI
ncbi:MAG: hypothetical protein IJH00_01280 [Erysipelotrichaceae bacterium]|nr:hypothetical protein [Erysipelotrichaceae bacterium]